MKNGILNDGSVNIATNATEFKNILESQMQDGCLNGDYLFNLIIEHLNISVLKTPWNRTKVHWYGFPNVFQKMK